MKVSINNLNNEGQGICRVNDKVTFVPYALCGEVVDINIVDEHKKYNIANIENIITKSKDRVIPKCKYYYECGGCNLMHTTYDSEIMFKKNKVINNLEHIANIKLDNIDIEYDMEYNYRNHITLNVNKDKIGFYKNNTHTIIDIDYCYIADDTINRVFSDIRCFIKKYKDNNISKISIKHYDNIIINIESNSFNLIDEFKDIVLFNSLYINNKPIINEYSSISLKDKKYIISNPSFFQKNTNMCIKLYDYVKNVLNSDDCVLDLYCGVGSISIYIADKVSKVLGIEIIDNAIKDAKENSKLNKCNNVEFIRGRVEDNLPNLRLFNTVILDPPRSGVDKLVLKTIVDNNINKIVYVSCNSTTLARDLNYLKEYYDIVDVKLFDLFPKTKHVESVCVLKLKK